ncbi:serine hydrolase domain-containing protein [Ensifer sp. SL37]|uniref:serine hydrolase domain-containing protein n=1 Tax=Ensifer sp. SL37 TaxID=2995137 RepID=UPI002272A5F2|nr:serine hydrolase domain-containing protein [Ensifer sp. SL37]MCY1745070.1 serine hydrolase [Ensifer sp. SL37]
MQIENLLVDLATRLLPAVPIEGRIQPMSLHERMAYHNVPGVSLALSDGASIATTALGSADSGCQMTEGTILQAASASKAITAFLSLMMVERGLLPLDSDLRPLLKSWMPEDASPFTLLQLASHTAGFNVHGFDGYARDYGLPTLTQILGGEAPAKNAAIKQIAKPGTQFKYSGGGYTLLELLLEDVCGRSFEELVKEYVFAPLSMEASDFQPAPPHPLAAGFDANGERVQGGHLVYPERAAAGLWTTPGDLVKFCNGVRKALSGDGILSGELAGLFTKPQDDLGVMNFGFFNGPGGWIEHGGANAGFRVQMWLCDHHALAIISNGDGGSLLNREILHGLAQMAGWDEIMPTPAIPCHLERRSAESFCGGYVFAGDSGIGVPVCEIFMRNGALHFSVEDEWFELVHVGDGAFIVPTRPGFRVVMDGEQLALLIYEDVFRASRQNCAGVDAQS